jgi:uncharacterized membrane protein YsdA (DUF1294 family)
MVRKGRGRNRDVQGARPPFRRCHPRLPFPPIVGGFLLAGAILTTATTWLFLRQLHVGAVPAYLAGVNLTTLGAYLYDKSAAGGAIGAVAPANLWRVPEAVLHLLALAGGTPAALAGQQIFQHKARKRSFQAWFWVIVVAQVIAAVAWAYPWGT